MITLTNDELIVDLFAGGGGASQGIFEATGRHPDIAVNHDEAAIAAHTVNHPQTKHLCASVWNVDPLKECGGRPVGLLWASPDCRFFSRARGKKPTSKSVRSLPGVVLTWATRVRPRAIFVENVAEIQAWSPIGPDGEPCKRRKGLSFKIWVGRLRGLGYRVEFKELCAADYGVPTIRTRFVLIAMRDNAPIAWPKPTHSKTPSMFEKPWRSAAECINWDRRGASIFGRKRPLEEATLRRIASGIFKCVINNPHPYIVTEPSASNESSIAHITSFYGTNGGTTVGAPLGTITAQGTHHAIVTAHLKPLGDVDRDPASSPRSEVPGDGSTGGAERLMFASYIAQHNTGLIGRLASAPLSTITTTGAQQAVVEAHMAPVSAAEGGEIRSGAHRVYAFLAVYYSQGGNVQKVDAPLGTITTKGRFSLITVSVAGVEMVIHDITMRMLTVDELAKAQGFLPNYDMSAGGKLIKTTQIRLIGNSVCPAMAAAVIKANVKLPSEQLVSAAA